MTAAVASGFYDPLLRSTQSATTMEYIFLLQWTWEEECNGIKQMRHDIF